jgi:hypothetical protein
MKKYIITESQYNNLSEQITIASGSMDFNPIYNTISRLIDDLGQEAVSNDSKEYLSNVAGLSDEEITKLIGNTNNLYKLEHKSKRNTDLICGVIYYISKKNYELTVVGNLSYSQSFKSEWVRNFFDEELETFVGFMSFFHTDFKSYPDAVIVKGVQVIDNAKSQGYGKLMYLSLFEEYSVIKSDDFLFTQSLNIWVNVLPKYTYVWLVNESRKKFKRIQLKGNLPIFENYDYFIASKEKVL